MKRISLKHLILLAATWTLASAASAQYVWTDEKGVKQYSDMPPPSSVPESRILKPRGRAAAAPQPAETTSAKEDNNDSGTAEKKGPLTTAEKNAEFQKRRAEQVEKEKKANEEAKVAAENAKNCERAREYQRSLESGQRIARTDKNGERAFLTDEQRAQELNEARRRLDQCKS